ncbi:MAG: hypothetical protein IJE27_03090, partial [Anaerotignum sp.]|nr:hypothetical protein [Anaerotignum sp.]
MDDRFDNKDFSETRYPRRADRQTVSFGSKTTESAEKNDSLNNYDHLKYKPEAHSVYDIEKNIRTEEPEEWKLLPESERTHRKRPQKRRRKRHMKSSAKAVIVLLIALVIGGGMFFAMNRLMNPPAEEMEMTGTTVTITIPDGAGTETIANILKEHDLIDSVFGFKLTSKMEGFDGTYKQGTYSIDTGMTKRQ